MTPFSYLKSFAFVILFSALSFTAMGQQPAQINYQGVARKADGSPVSEQQISLRLSIHDGGAAAAVVYSETRSLRTNKFGLFTTVIGSAGAGSQTGNINTINWSSGNKFLQVELDPDGGSNFQNLGTSQLQSVPYAIYANQAQPSGQAGGDLSGSFPNPTVSRIQGSAVSNVAPQNGQVLRWNGTAWAPGDAGVGSASPVTVSATAPVQTATAGSNTTISLSQSGASADGFLSRADWLLFSNKTSKEYVDAEIKSAKAYADAIAVTAAVSDATAILKGKVQLAGDLSGTASAPVIADGKITGSKIADGAVTDAKIAAGISASKVGLGNVNNTSDLAKPVSTATQAALDTKIGAADLALKAPLASPTFTGTVSGINKTMVGLANVDNTSDAAKPISSATQAALDTKIGSADLALKAPLASPNFTGTVSGITKTMVGLAEVENTSDLAKPVSTATQLALDTKANTSALAIKADQSTLELKANLASPTFTGTVSGITKTMVGLGNVDNTSDAAKPISTATQAALDQKGSNADLTLKAPLASPTFTGTVSGITKTMVGLADVDNTSDAAKPISTAAQTALNARELLANKSVSIITDGASDEKYPSAKAVKTYTDAAAPEASTTVSGKITLAGDLAGTAALPVVAAGAINDTKISATAAIADTKLATISTAGKVANTATTAASANTASAIVARDGSGNFTAGTITASLTGTASVATSISGGSAGAIPYQSAANTTAMLAAGSAGQVLQSNGAAAPSWVPAAALVREVADEITATASQTSFTLSQTPSANSKVKMYVNGIRISKNAYSSTGTTLTYVPGNNGGYAFLAGDRIQFDYYY